MNHGKIILTSTGLTQGHTFFAVQHTFSNHQTPSVAIITTAEGPDHGKYSERAKSQFQSLKFCTVDFVDLASEPVADLTNYDVIYVSGGNTYRLLAFARSSNFRTSIVSLLDRGGMYIGVSAGSIILGPSIAVAGEILSDPIEMNLTDFTGLCIIPNTPLPHYTPALEDAARAFELKHNVVIDRIRNSEAIIIDANGKTLLK
ncbi:MAG: Type 1 glutamine amidotransferase-like domain-containing protein [Patescibacteria group bacterium]